MDTNSDNPKGIRITDGNGTDLGIKVPKSIKTILISIATALILGFGSAIGYIIKSTIILGEHQKAVHKEFVQFKNQNEKDHFNAFQYSKENETRIEGMQKEYQSAWDWSKRQSIKF